MRLHLADGCFNPLTIGAGGSAQGAGFSALALGGVSIPSLSGQSAWPARVATTRLDSTDMHSKDNQKMPGNKGLLHILGYRMKFVPAALKTRILGKEGAQSWSGHGTDDKSEEGRYKVIEREGSRIIVTYSPTRV